MSQWLRPRKYSGTVDFRLDYVPEFWGLIVITCVSENIPLWQSDMVCSCAVLEAIMVKY